MVLIYRILFLQFPADSFKIQLSSLIEKLAYKVSLKKLGNLYSHGCVTLKALTTWVILGIV